MSTILFTTIDAGGNLPPALAVAHELGTRGHRIMFLGHASQKQRIEGAGFEFTPYSSTRSWVRTERLRATRVIADYVYAATSKRMAQDFLELARAQRADLTVVDCMLPGISKAARQLAAPTAVLFHTFYAYWRGPWAHGPIGRLAQLRGVNPLTSWHNADIEIVATDPALDPAASPALDPAAASARVGRIWTGVAEPVPNSDHAVQKRPRVLVSLSSTWFPGQVEAYRRIVAALAELPVDAVVTTGGLATAEELAPPDNVSVVGFADHAALLPSISLVVGHGGHSTTMKAVVHGIPLLIMPMHPFLDQPMIGAAIQNAGLGLSLAKKSPPTAIRDAIARLLADSRFRDAAAESAIRQRSAHGVIAAADALVAVLESGSRAPASAPARAPRSTAA